MQPFDLKDFQWLEYYPTHICREPELTFNVDSLVFNAASLRKLGHPPSVKVLFDPDSKRIALQGFARKAHGTIDFPEARKARDFGIYRLERVRFLRDLMPAWDEGARFKVRGAFYEAENVMVYDLNAAVVFQGGAMPVARE